MYQITINVNGHDVTITTDKEITTAYLAEIVDYINKIEGM